MGNRSFFNALHDREGDFLLATVLEGPAQGERVLLWNTAPGLAGGTACVLGGTSACLGRCDLQWNSEISRNSASLWSALAQPRSL